MPEILRPRPETGRKEKESGYEGVNISHDDLIERAALKLEADQRYPHPAKKGNLTLAKQAIREVLKEENFRFIFISSSEERRIESDAYEVLEMFE